MNDEEKSSCGYASDGKLSPGGIAGIVIAAIVVVIVGIFIWAQYDRIKTVIEMDNPGTMAWQKTKHSLYAPLQRFK